MKTLSEIQTLLQEHLPDLQEHYHVETLGVFGSYVRGEQTKESDLDVLVTFSQTPDLLEFVNLSHYLENLLGVKVDLSMGDALKPYLAPYILEEVQYLSRLSSASRVSGLDCSIFSTSFPPDVPRRRTILAWVISEVPGNFACTT